MNSELKIPVPTAGGSAGSKNLLYRRIHQNADFSFILDSAIACIDLFSDPVLEFLTYDGSDHIADVGPWQLEDLFSLTGQGPHGFSVWVAFCVLDEVLDRQAVEIGHLDHLNRITADAPSLV